MFKNTLNFYFIFWILIFVVSLSSFANEYVELYWFNFFVFLTYFLVLRINSSLISNHKLSTLLFIIAVYSAFFIVILNMISYDYRGNYFVFSEADSRFYERTAQQIAYNFNNAKNIYSRLSFDDWGAVTLVSFAYMFEESNLMLNFIYWLFGILSSYYLFKLAKSIMSSQYAFLCVLTFAISSYILWFESSGLKESAILFLVINCYYHLYRYLKDNSRQGLFIGIFSLVLLFFFRAAIPILIGGSFFISIILQKKSNALKVFLIASVVIISISFSFVFEFLYDRFFLFDRDVSYIEIKENVGMIKGGVFLTVIMNILASLIGPLPTFVTTELNYLSVYAPGLFMKNLLSFYFLMGAFMIIKNKLYSLFPIVIFPLLEMISLVILFEALELRKSLPHFPMLYLVMFWFLYKVDSSKKINKKKNYNLTYLIYVVVLVTLVIIWNFRN